MNHPPSDRTIVFCIGAVQFVNILDFVIVMPLGPDFARALGIPLSHLGYVGGAYTAAACVSGLAGAFFLDRFDRRKALAVAMLGLVLGTLSSALATGFGTLILARLVAGTFGGPATSLSYSIVADVIPEERRGKAMGAVMGAFAVASVVGVPAGLELARRGGWMMPFFAVAALGAVLGTYTYVVLPPMTAHLAKKRAPSPTIASIAFRPEIGLSLSMTFVIMSAAFIMVPNMTPYILGNLHYPRERLGLLYLVGGCVSFVATRAVGALVDRWGSARVGTFGVLFASAVTYVGFVLVPPPISVMAIFIGLMLGMAFRNVAYNTLASKVPHAHERARFTSVQSSVQHFASALGAFASSELLGEGPGGTLAGVATIAYVSIAVGSLLVPLLFVVERRVTAR